MVDLDKVPDMPDLAPIKKSIENFVAATVEYLPVDITKMIDEFANQFGDSDIVVAACEVEFSEYLEP